MDDGQLDKFTEKSKPEKLLATAAKITDADDLFSGSGNAGNAAAADMDDDLFSMAGSGSGGGGKVAAADGFDFAAYINSNSAAPASASSLFDD